MKQVDYDVAVSFGTADLGIAEEMHRRLCRRGVSVYLYREVPEETLGVQLAGTLRRIFCSATVVIVLVAAAWGSEHTRLELDAALGGQSANGGIVPVRVDDTPLPPRLHGLTWWSLAHGTDDLIRAVLAMLRRRPLTTLWLLLGCLLMSACAGTYVLVVLGFREPMRWPDAVLHAAAVAPLAWVAVARVGPHLVTRLRARRLRGAVLLQTPLLRRIEACSPYLIALSFLAVVVSVGYATVVAQRVRTVYATRAAALTLLESRWTELHGVAVTLDNLGARAASSFLPAEIAKSTELAAEYARRLETAAQAPRRDAGIVGGFHRAGRA